MTFEASRKKQNLVLQPRGKALYEDDSTFASKLMAKMGWEKGKGLGKEQHGNIDFIQIRYKNNASGLGFQGLKDNQWTQHEDTFNSLLNKLNRKETNGESSNGADQEQFTEIKKTRKSLEEQSKKSRARVHYQKFTRGKDISRYSSKDLANIFGKKTLDEDETATIVDQEIAEDDNNEIKNDAYESTLIVNTGVSVSDYFKQKLEQKKKNAGTIPNEPTDESFVDVPEKSKKSIKASENIEDVVEAETSKSEDEPKNSKKKKKKLLEIESIVPEMEVVLEDEEKPKKKKKKTQETKKSLPENEKVPIIDQLILAFEQDSENDKLKPKKSKKKKLQNNFNEVENPANEELSQETPKKKKSKSKVVLEEKQNDIEEVIQTKKSKKKKRTESTEVTEVQSKKQKLAECPEESESSKPSEFITGMNLVYSTNVIQINTVTAKKLTNLAVKDFTESNCANIVGYGLSEQIQLKTVQTQMLEDKGQLDKYSLYHMVSSRDKLAPKKMLAKLRKPKNSFSVL